MGCALGLVDGCEVGKAVGAVGACVGGRVGGSEGLPMPVVLVIFSTKASADKTTPSTLRRPTKHRDILPVKVFPLRNASTALQ